MKIAFFGTPEFAVPSLKAIVNSKRHKVVCVVTQPDRPSGRGSKAVPSAVKKAAAEYKIPVLQPERISREVNLLDPYQPDIIVTCAFGQLLKQNVLDYCKFGVINVHGSLLPKYRGSSPIQWAVINGERTTGVTIMQTDIGLDTGDIIVTKETEIGESETAGDLFDRLSIIGAELLLTALDKIENGTAVRTSQNDKDATHFPMLSKEGARIDFSKTSVEIVNFVRGMNPWPVAWLEHNGEIIRVYKAQEGKGSFCKPCKDGFVSFEIIQMPGGKVLPVKDYINGRKIHI